MLPSESTVLQREQHKFRNTRYSQLGEQEVRSCSLGVIADSSEPTELSVVSGWVRVTAVGTKVVDVYSRSWS